MSNYAWVCFACKASVRRDRYVGDVRCPTCSLPCDCLGYKTPIPPKTKTKEWITLRDSFYLARREREANANLQRVQQIHYLEHEIAKLAGLPANTGRASAIKLLTKTLDKARGL
jgi:hypothetical protein